MMLEAREGSPIEKRKKMTRRGHGHFETDRWI
jgi:hypothetical protein